MSHFDFISIQVSRQLSYEKHRTNHRALVSYSIERISAGSVYSRSFSLNSQINPIELLGESVGV